ncbi:MAG TPA: aspartyl/asparaginyl beta-hydroxylase domain-containing protein [Pseudolabrys sp.]|nr:aspartyl/asparaginyl beta-hydroxylase domain-containing protein [Pseudolabrys sp.]
MPLDRPLVRLFDHPVQDILSALPDSGSPSWDDARFRQKAYSAHSTTRAIVFYWLPNHWVAGTPVVVLRKPDAPKPLMEAVSAVAVALEQRLDGKVAKLMLAELAPGAKAARHRDKAPALTAVHRCHFPVLTNKDVSFMVDDEDFYLEPGVVYEFDNTRMHGVRNRSDRPRVQLICDIMPAALLGLPRASFVRTNSIMR